MTDECVRPTVICSAFIEKNKKFLLVFCPKFRVWRVPGGRVDNNETLEDTIYREMNEEIGLTIKNVKFVGWAKTTNTIFDQN
jgi:ADP-ribose pyrophosphatase YjhB (NUDIX family)